MVFLATLVFAHAGHWIELPVYLAPVVVVVLWLKLSDRKRRTRSDGGKSAKRPDASARE